MDDRANIMATEQCTVDVLAVKDQDRGSQERKAASDAVRVRMQEIAAQAWAEKPGFAEAAKVCLWYDCEEYVWALIAKHHSHIVVLEDLPSDQQWITD
jgi:hypothetical protein